MTDVRVVPLESFTGYPGSVRTRFTRGEPTQVSPEYATLLHDKGLIKRPKFPRTAPDAADE